MRRGQWRNDLLARHQIPRLSVYAALLLLALGVLQLIGSLAFYQAIDRQTLREDHARRVAELLVVSERVYAREGSAAAAIMTTRHLVANVSASPLVAQPGQGGALGEIAGQIFKWEPSLASRALHLAITPPVGDDRDLVGSLRLADGNWLNFRSRDISSMWPIALRATLLTVGTTLACLGIGLLALRHLTTPLRRLSDAADAIGAGRMVPIRETGPRDLRTLARSMNAMQQRIAGLLRDQAKSFEAISHDLRTPLARQQLAADLITDRELGEMVRASADEMEAMLVSLQQYLRAQHLTAEPDVIDLDAAVRHLVEQIPGEIGFDGGGAHAVETYCEPLLLSLRALMENAVRFADVIEVATRRDGETWLVEIKDNGPGIPADHFEDILAPFFRLDTARARDTKGFGLGIPTAHRLLHRFGGQLCFLNAEGGGLIVRIHVPHPHRD